MDALRDVAVIAALFLLRISLPLLVTLSVGYLLARLDGHWQAVELERRSRAEASSKLIEPPRCWEMKGCDPATRDQCPAYLLRPLACWQAFRKLNGGQLPERCFSCPVFMAA